MTGKVNKFELTDLACYYCVDSRQEQRGKSKGQTNIHTVHKLGSIFALNESCNKFNCRVGTDNVVYCPKNPVAYIECCHLINSSYIFETDTFSETSAKAVYR